MLILGAVAASLVLSPAAHAHGDPASEQLAEQSIFLPLNGTIRSRVLNRLTASVREAEEAGVRIKVALIATPEDLGTAFTLYRKPQRYADYLARDLASVYRDRLLVVMPNGFGYAANGKPAPRFSRTLAGLAGPGKEPTKQAEAATTAVRRLAAAAGHRLPLPSGGESEARDRITIAAAAVAGLALIAAFVLFRRQRRAQPN